MRVSLVIPVRDEAATVDVLVRSIQTQTRAPDEVVIVDGGSTDETVARLRTAANDDARFRIIEAGDATPGRGRNVGVDAAVHEWIAFTDAGIRLDAQWLEHLVAAAAETDADAVFGTFDVEEDSRFAHWARLAFVPATTPVGDGRRRARGPFLASSLVRKEAWKRAGGFPDVRSGEDLLFMRAVEGNGPVAWAPDARVWWRPPAGLAQTFRRFRTYSASGVRIGLAAEWQYGVARYWLAASAFVVLAAARRSPRWLAIPVAGLVARAVRQAAAHRADDDRPPITPLDVAAVAAITIVTDAATFIGWAEAVLGGSGRRGAVREMRPARPRSSPAAGAPAAVAPQPGPR